MIYFYHGSDIKLLDHQIKLLISELSIKNSHLNLQNRSFYSNEELILFLDENSLFPSQSIIKVKKEVKYFSELTDCQHIFVFYSYEEKNNFIKSDSADVVVKEFNLPKPWDMEKLIIQKLGVKIDRKIVPYIASCLQSTMEINEIEENIQFHHINLLTLANYRLVLPYPEINIFFTVDSFFQKNLILYLSQLQDFLSSGESVDSFIFNLQSKVNQYIKIKKMLQTNHSDDQIAKKLSLPKFIIKKNMDTIRQFSLNQLENICIKILQTHFFIRRSGGIANQYYLEKLFLEKIAG